MIDQDNRVSKFLELLKVSKRGKFKLYLGMIAGVGKTYRMLEEAHQLLNNSVDVRIGIIETHGRAETEKLAEGIPIIPLKKMFYKGKELEELDLTAILNIHPDVVLVDELAHTNIPGSKNEKRWQDVIELLESRINVISAVNIQHIESLCPEVESITGIEVKERIPDKILAYADEIVNIDLPAADLIERLKSGKIYDKSKIETALTNFFKEEKILPLRDLALREVSKHIVRKIEKSVTENHKIKEERILCCIGANFKSGKELVRKAARLALIHGAKWQVLIVQQKNLEYEKIDLSLQRHIDENLKLAYELGAEVLIVKGKSIPETVFEVIEENNITILLLGRPLIKGFSYFFRNSVYDKIISKVGNKKVMVITL